MPALSNKSSHKSTDLLRKLDEHGPKMDLHQQLGHTSLWAQHISTPLVSPGHEIKTEFAREMFESSLMRPRRRGPGWVVSFFSVSPSASRISCAPQCPAVPRARVLLTQGKAPQDLNGLLLVHPDDFHVFAAGICENLEDRAAKMAS